MPEADVREHAWWLAEQAARYAGLDSDPDVRASIAARALTDAARRRAQRSQLGDGEHRWMWTALHHATNPDPVAGAIEAMNSARYAAGGHAAELVSRAQERLSRLHPDLHP